MQQLLAGFDQFSFWLGFAAAILFLWFYRRVGPALIEAWQRGREQAASRRDSLRLGGEYDYRNDFIRYIQGIHLAAPLFSLEEILIPPRILAPPPRIDPGDELPPTDTFARVLAYLPDFPEFASAFEAEKLTLPAALSRGANLALIGAPGAGKTTALAHLGTLAASLSPDAGELADLVPFYVHAADLGQFPEEGADMTASLADVIWNAGYLSRRTAPRFYSLVASAFGEGRVLLLLDGLDELAPSGMERVNGFLAGLLDQHPATRVVAAVSPEYYDGITRLGLVPVVMAGWSLAERMSFIRRWGRLWQKNIDANIWDRAGSGIEPGILYNWLGGDTAALTPLELTLRTWAVFAGDAAGSRNSDLVEAYVRRMTVGIIQVDTALQRIGAQMALTRRTAPHNRQASLWARGRTEETAAEETPDAEPQEPAEEDPGGGRVGRGAVPALVSAGLLVPRSNDLLSFSHPLFAAYFAGCGLAAFGGAAAVAAQPNWWLRQWALHYAAAEIDIGPILKAIESPDPLSFTLLASGKWIRDIKAKSEGQMMLMRRLVALFQDEKQPAAVRQGAIAALALSGEQAPVTLSARLISSPDHLVRSMCALVLGYARDEKYVPELTEALSDQSFPVRSAACYALVRIGTQQAIETVATILLHGDEDTQRAAAEALSNDREEGIELLKEAVSMDDLLVRRAAIFGLGKSGLRSARETIRGLQLEDDQWIVRNAADQEIQKMDLGSPAIPRPHKPLHETGWLIAFAGESGEGIAPGRMAEETLLRALRSGNHEQILAALERYKIYGKEEVWGEIYRIAGDSYAEVQNAAVLTLWHLQAQGITAD